MSNSSTSGQSRYVWDEWEEEPQAPSIKLPQPPARFNDARNVPSANSVSSRAMRDLVEQRLAALEIDEMTTVSSIGLESFAGRNGDPRSKSIGHDNGREDSVSQLAREIADRVDSMKSELQALKTQERKLQGELRFLEESRERREKKLGEKYQAQLQQQETVHSQTIADMISFRDQIKVDIRKMDTQTSELQGKIRKVAQDIEGQVRAQRAENEKKLDKARKQWRAEEKTFVDKVFASRHEQMKQQAVEALTPELDSLVRAQKEALEAARVEKEHALQKLRRSIDHDVQRQLAEYRRALQEDVRHETTRAEDSSRKHVENAQRALDREQEQIKEQFEQDKTHMEAEYDRLRQQEDQMHQQAMSRLQEQQSALVQQLLEEQQQEIAQRVQRQASELQQLQKQLKEDEQQFQETVSKVQSQQIERAYQRCLQLVQAELSAETLAVQQRLQAEAVSEKARIVAEREQALQKIRDSNHNAVAQSQDEDRKAQQRVQVLRREVEQARAQLDSLREHLPGLQYTLTQELRPRVQELRSALHAVEAEFKESEIRWKQEREDLIAEKEGERERLRDDVQKQQAAFDTMIERLKKQQEQLDQETESDLTRIQSRVARMTENKRQQIQQKQQELTQLRADNLKLEQELEALRNASYR